MTLDSDSGRRRRDPGLTRSGRGASPRATGAPDEPLRAPQVTAERARATVMFADIVGFTALSEKLGAERAYLVVTGCLRLLDGIAREHGGSVDKYLGDSVMAVFGYPVPLDNAAGAAADAAVEMRQAVADYNRELRLELPLDLRIGINTGVMVAGDIRGPVIREFHVLGDAVNVAARLKARAPRGRIYIGPETHDATADRFECHPLEALRLKGKRERVPAYELVASRQAENRGPIARGERFSCELVGRGAELARLRLCASRLQRGQGAVVGLVGEEGSGKTRLLAELRTTGALDPFQVLETRSSPLAQDRRYATFAGLLRSRAEIAEGDDDERIRRRVRDVLERLSTEAPLVLVFEDLQWADAPSLELLEWLLDLSADRPICFVVSLRPDSSQVPHPILAAARERHAASLEEIQLRPLDPDQSFELIDRVAGDEELSEETKTLIAERGRGNPSRLIMGIFLAPALRSESDRSQRGRERTSEAERRRATILFADITGFTAMTEKLGAEEAYPIVAGCLQLLDDIARKHGGTVDKYLGDCVMALFGVPEAIEDAPRGAVNAAIEMRQRVRDYNRQSALPISLDVHTGIHTGLGIAGDISGPLLREFAVMGDPVDVADRLKDLAPAGSVYVGAETYRFTRHVFEYQPLEPAATEDAPPESYELVSQEQRLYRARIGSERQIISVLVGRDAELLRLKECVSRLAAGQGGIASLIAEAGIGKSRLVAELGASVDRERVSWHEGRSLSTGQQLSFNPFADLCRSWTGITDEDDDEQARRKLEDAAAVLGPEEAGDVVPFIATILGMRFEEHRERLERIQGEAMERMIRRSVTQLLRHGSAGKPVVVVMDDLHWADLSSIELLESLLRLADDTPILFLNVFRPGFAATSERIRKFAREHHPARHLEIELEPLDGGGSRQLINNLFKQGDIPHATRALIEEKARGNPFYIEEVVRSLVDAGAVEYRDGSFRATEKIHSVVIPGTVQEVIMARVDRLDPRRKHLLQLASVVGRSFHRDVVGEIAAEGSHLEEDFRELEGAEFIVPWDRFQGVEYAFKHPLIQEATYDGILETRREELHRDVAGAIEARLPEDIPGYCGMLAYHFSKGRDAERAEEFLFRAGDEAARVAASSEALHFFQEASKLYLQMHGDGGDPAKKALLEKNVAAALYYRGQFIEAVGHFNRALGFLGERVPRGQVEVLLRFARNLLSVLARLYLPGKRQRAGATPRQRDVIDLMYNRGQAQTTTSPTRFVFDGMDTLATLQRVDPGTVPGSGGMYAGCVGIFAFGGLSFEISRRFLDIASRLVGESDLREYLMYRCMNFVHHLLEGDWSDGHEVEESMIDEGLRYGALWEVTTYLGWLGEKRIHRGDFGGAREAIERIDKIWDLYQYDLAKTNHYYLRTALALEESPPDEALRAADAYYDENPEDLLHINALGSKAKAQALLGDLGAAEETLARGAELAAKSSPVAPFHLSSCLRSRFLLDLLRLEEAVAKGDRRGRREYGARGRKSARAARRSAGRVAWRKLEVWRLTGRYHWLRGDQGRARRWWQQSIETGQRLGAWPELARTYLEVGQRLGESHSRSGELSGIEAPAYLEMARETFEKLAMGWDLERLAEVMSRASSRR